MSLQVVVMFASANRKWTNFSLRTKALVVFSIPIAAFLISAGLLVRLESAKTEAELHRVRGEMLLKSDPTNPARAEEALRSAIAVAQRQGTRSFELRAALALAKLLQSTGRPVDAYAVLAPAVEGFSPTPEMPEIDEAQTLLTCLA